MKKLFILLLFSVLLVVLGASPCFEDVEAVAYSTIASFLSFPRITLPGVTIKSDGVIPEEIVFSSSDVSLYYDALSGSNRMKKEAKEKLEKLNYKRGDLIINGKIKLESVKKIEIIPIIFNLDYSSLDVLTMSNLTLRKRENEWKICGEVEVFGDSFCSIVVNSKELKLNYSPIAVNLKYRVTRGEL